MKRIFVKILSFLKPKGNAAGRGAVQATGGNSLYNQEDRRDDENAISLNAIKNKYNKKDESHGEGATIYSPDEDNVSDLEASNKKVDKTKVISNEKSDDGSDGGENDSESEEAGGSDKSSGNEN